MVFCFPSKRLRRLFSDDDHETLSSSTALAKKPQSSAPASSPAAPSRAVIPQEKAKGAPKVAIIIYSMYGHIAKSKSFAVHFQKVKS